MLYITHPKVLDKRITRLWHIREKHLPRQRYGIFEKKKFNLTLNLTLTLNFDLELELELEGI